MIYATGIDIVDTGRIKENLSEKFINRIFNASEIKYCENKKNAHLSYAGHFAAKEALVKALKTGISEGITFKDITVKHSPKGCPFIELKDKAKEQAEKKQIKNIHLSISHEKKMAIALVILEK